MAIRRNAESEPDLPHSYFLAATPSTERHLYQAHLPHEAGDSAGNVTALTDIGVPGYHAVSFSPRAGFYVLNYQGPDIPRQTLVTVDEPGPCSRYPFCRAALNIDGFATDLNVVIEDNAKLNATSAEYCMPIRSHSVIESDGVGEPYCRSQDPAPP